MNKKIPSYYNNFKRNEEIEDMVTWKAWFAASAAALFGMAGTGAANYANQMKPIVQKQHYEVAAIPQETVNTNVERISDSLNNAGLTDEQYKYIKSLEKIAANNAKEKKEENKKPTQLELATDYLVERQYESIMGNLIDGLLGALFGGD
tara:strand:- start:319 stop:765 length:447 start_codon:yes stop_codon:yes gene_type:complete